MQFTIVGLKIIWNIIVPCQVYWFSSSKNMWLLGPLKKTPIDLSLIGHLPKLEIKYIVFGNLVVYCHIQLSSGSSNVWLPGTLYVL